MLFNDRVGSLLPLDFIVGHHRIEFFRVQIVIDHGMTGRFQFFYSGGGNGVAKTGGILMAD